VLVCLFIAIIFIAIMSQIKLNKFEKEKRGIELYKEGKTIREIAEEVLISFRDISQIIKKFIEDTMKTKKYKRKYQFKIYLFLREKSLWRLQYL
jgi:hypothetical protein